MSEERLVIPLSVGVAKNGGEADWKAVMVMLDPQQKDIQRFVESIAIEVVKILRGTGAALAPRETEEGR